jgi:hypothetical protein
VPRHDHRRRGSCRCCPELGADRVWPRARLRPRFGCPPTRCARGCCSYTSRPPPVPTNGPPTSHRPHFAGRSDPPAASCRPGRPCPDPAMRPALVTRAPEFAIQSPIRARPRAKRVA